MLSPSSARAVRYLSARRGARRRGGGGGRELSAVLSRLLIVLVGAIMVQRSASFTCPSGCVCNADQDYKCSGTTLSSWKPNCADCSLVRFTSLPSITSDTIELYLEGSIALGSILSSAEFVWPPSFANLQVLYVFLRL